MKQTGKPDRPECPSRRAALRRLAGAAVAGYIVPEVLFLSAARAGSSIASAPSGGPSAGTVLPPSGASASSSSASSAEEGARETCSVSGPQGSSTISISRSDLERSQQAIQAGYAKPLDQIWGEFTAGYDGKVIGVEFLDRQSNPRYRFRAISSSGRLETVTISAQTGLILRIVGC